MNASTNRPALITADSLAVDYAHLIVAADDLTAHAAHDIPKVVEDDEDLGIITQFVKDIRTQRKRVSEIGDGEKRPFLDAHKTLHTWFNQLWQRLGELQDAVEARGNVYLAKKQSEERRRREEVERKAREEAEAARVAAIEAAKNPAAAAAAIKVAAEAQAKADDASRASAAKPADMARTRTAAGTATLRTNIEFTFDREKLDLGALRPFFREDELRACINAIAIKNKDAIVAGTFKLAGVIFSVGTKGLYK